MPIGEFRAWLGLRLAELSGDPDQLADAQRRSNQYHTGILRHGERCYSVRLAQIEGFYHYHVPPLLPPGMPEEAAFRGVAADKCKWDYANMDRCLFTWSQNDRKNWRQFHTRVHACHRPFELFMKCVTGRDVHILRNIERWERDHVKFGLKSDLERKNYLAALRQDSQFYDYMYKITDLDKRVSCYYEKRQKEFQRRLKNLIEVIHGKASKDTVYLRPQISKGVDVGRGHYVISQK